MLYLVVFNECHDDGSKEWLIEGIFDNKEEAESVAEKLCNETLEKYKKKYIEKSYYKEIHIKVIPVTLNQNYESFAISIDNYDD